VVAVKLANLLADQKVENFTKHYHTFYSLVFSVVYSRINNYHDAEDICQEVFIRFYRKLNEIDNPRKWLFGCLRIVVLDFYKKRNRDHEDLDSLLNDIDMGYVNGFKEARVVISQIIDEISGECSENENQDASIFQLVAVHRYRITEAAKHLKLSYKQTRYRYNRICEKILSRLREKGIKELGDLL
jgi:RNA polymerase sigma-70 factor (ECF subfamily)